MHYILQRKRTGLGLLPSGLAAAALTSPFLLLHAPTAAADISLPPVSVGAGLQTNYYNCDKSCIYSSGTPHKPGGSVQGFDLDSIRLYVNGSVTSRIKLTFDTEYTGSGGGLVFSPHGQFLAFSARRNDADGIQVFRTAVPK